MVNTVASEQRWSTSALERALKNLLRFVPCNHSLKTCHKRMFLNRDGYIEALI
jgi:hypothetical protein